MKIQLLVLSCHFLTVRRNHKYIINHKKKEIEHRQINNSVTKHKYKRQSFVSCIYILLFPFILLYYKYNIKQYISLHTIRAHTYPTMMSFFSYFLRCQTNMIDGGWVLKEKELKDGPFPFPFLRR